MNIGDLANISLTVDAFIQHLENHGIRLVETNGRFQVVSVVSHRRLENLKKEFKDKIISTAINEQLKTISDLEAIVKTKDRSNTSL